MMMITYLALLFLLDIKSNKCHLKGENHKHVHDAGAHFGVTYRYDRNKEMLPEVGDLEFNFMFRFVHHYKM